jgi:hypothetical protein
MKTYVCIYLAEFFSEHKNVSDKSCVESQNTHMLNNFFNENCAINEIMWRSMVEPDRPQVTVHDAQDT